MWTVVVRDPQGSELHRVPLNGRMVIGRTPDCQIVLKSIAVSRQHARLELFKDHPVLVDLGSSNGSLLNGQPLAKPAMVDEKSRIEIGGFKISLERASAPAHAPTPPPVAPANPPTEGDLDLVPMAAPAAPPVAPKPATPPGMNFLDIPSAPPPTASAPKPRAATDSAVDLLDQQLAGIRNYRDDTLQGEKARAAQVDSEWREVLASMQQLKEKVGKHPKVQHFTFSRDQQEVSIKVEDSSKRGYCYYVLARRHPTGKYDYGDMVWLCELGSEELSYKKPKEAMADLVRRLAPRLA